MRDGGGGGGGASVGMGTPGELTMMSFVALWWGRGGAGLASLLRRCLPHVLRDRRKAPCQRANQMNAPMQEARRRTTFEHVTRALELPHKPDIISLDLHV